MKAKTNKTLEKLNDYEAFVEKFKPKKTTDDCYTPPYIYDTVLQWLRRNADLEGREIIRPFWPGDDYKTVDYPEGCVVVDNPPFSILAEIKRFYLERGIRFFLFAPHLTLFSTDNDAISYIIANAQIRYENGAVVNTGFVTNLPEFAEYGIIGEASLHEEPESVQRKALQEEGKRKELPKYAYPPHLVTVSSIAYLISAGVNIRIPRGEMQFVKRLDEQVKSKKAIFGGGFLTSNRMAEKLKAEKLKAEKLKAEKLKAEKLKAEKLKAEKLKAAHQWQLSERELELIEKLDPKYE